MASRQVTTLPVKELTVANGNWDTSRKTIDRVVIHTMVGTIKSADARFNNSTAKVSAHYGVGLDGSIVHWVDEDNTAYHAGSYDMNQRSIGIEHEDNGKYDDPRPDVLYTTSAKLVRDICQFYNIPIDRTHILKHSQVVATGCPDALDIDRIVNEAQNASGDPTETIKTKDLIQLRDREQILKDVCVSLKFDIATVTSGMIITVFENLNDQISLCQAALNEATSLPPQNPTNGGVASSGGNTPTDNTGGDATGSNGNSPIPPIGANPSFSVGSEVVPQTGKEFDFFTLVYNYIIKLFGGETKK